MKTLLKTFVATAFWLFVAAPLFATTYTWNPNISSGAWSDKTNWLVDGAAAVDYPRTIGADTGDEAIFNSAATVSLNGGVSVERITFNADVRLESANSTCQVVESYEWLSYVQAKVTLANVGMRGAKGRVSFLKTNVDVPANGTQECRLEGDDANINFTGKLTGDGLLRLRQVSGYFGVNLSCDARDFLGTIRIDGGSINRARIAGSNVGGERMRFEIEGSVNDNGTVSASDYWESDTIKFGSFYTKNYYSGFAFRLNQTSPIPVTFEIGHLNRNDDRLSLCTAQNGDKSGFLKIRKVGTGTLELWESRHNYGTELNDGVIKVTSEKVLNYYGMATSTLTFGTTEGCAGGTLLYGSYSSTPVTTDYSAIIKNSKKAISIDTGDERELVYATSLDASNVGGLRKKGPGTLTLTALPAYTGDTTVEAGTLVVPFGATLPGVVTVAEGAHLVVDMTGHVENGTYEILKANSITKGSAIEVKGVDGGHTSCDITIGEDGTVTAVIAMEKLVWAGKSGATWTSENAWVGARSGDPFTFITGDSVELTADGTEVVIPFESDLAVGTIHVTTANGGVVRILGAGTITTTDFVNDGDLRLAAGAGPITADFEFNGVGTTTFESGTVVMAKSVSQPVVNNAVAVRNSDWNPSYPMTGNGELRFESCTVTVASTACFKDFVGTVTVGPGAVLQARTELHGEGGVPQYKSLGAGTLKMAGGKIDGFGDVNGTNNEWINNVVLADDTVSEWINSKSRGAETASAGRRGCNVNILGKIIGSGTLRITSTARIVSVENDDLADFTGTIELNGNSFAFKKGIAGGTLAVLSGNPYPTIVKTNPLVIGAKATLAGEEGTQLDGVTFEKGSKFAFLDADALSDAKETYVGLTVPTLKALPAIAQEESGKGRWKAVKIANEDGSVSLGAVFRPAMRIILF